MSEETQLAKQQTGFIISASDIDIPRINLVQKTSNIDAPVGSVVLGKEHILAEVDQPVSCVAVSPVKGWKEDVPYGTDSIARMVYSENEANELAGESDFKVIEFAEITFLFRSTDDEPDPAAFPLPLGDDMCALGKIHVHKDAYRNTYKSLATWAAGNPDKTISDYEWTFKSSLMQRGPHSWFSPSLKPTNTKVGEAIEAFIKNIT